MAFCCCGAGGTASVTAKSTQHLRHLETIGIARGPSPRLRRTEVQIPVSLNVYSLLESNKKLSKLGMGVYHTGVVVYGIEWGYGEVVENPNASGLFCVHPGQAAGTLYRTIRIGYTTRSPMQVDTILHRLENEWRSCEYHILHHNCNHFAQAFCDLLSTTEKLQVPSWCNRAARVGDRVIPRKLATKVQHMMDDEPPKAVAPTPFCNINEVPLSVVPREWYLHPSVFQPMRYMGGSRPESLVSRDNVPAASGGDAILPAATTPSHNGGGSHYTVEYDILPPPGYEMADVGSPYPPLMHREVYLATDENESVSRITAIEEQPSVTRSSRVESTRKSTRSHRATKPTPGHSPTPPPLGTATASIGNDRVAVLPRVRASTSHPHSVAPTGSPQASVLDTETESVLHSDGSEDFPPHNVSRPEAAAAAPPRPVSSMEQSSVTKRLQNSVHLSTGAERGDREEVVLEQPLYTMRETSLYSTSLNNSMRSYGGAGHGEVERVPLVTHRQAQPVGSISARPSTAATPVAAKRASISKGRRRSTSAHDHHTATATTSATDTHSETSQDASTALDASKSKRAKESKMSRHKEKAESSQHSSGTKRLNDFSEIVEVPNGGPSDGSPNSSITASDTKKKKNPAWVFLFKARGTTAGSEGAKKGKKYLSTPPQSDVATHTDGDTTINNNLDTVSATSSFPASKSNSTMQPHRTEASKQQHMTTALTAATALTASAISSAARGGGADASTTQMVAESVSDTGLDARGVREATTVYVQATSPPPASLHSSSAAEDPTDDPDALLAGVRDSKDASMFAAGTTIPHATLPALLGEHDTPPSPAEGRRSPGVSAPSSPQNRRASGASSASELHLQPLPRRLSESAVALPASIGARELQLSPGAASLPELRSRQEDSTRRHTSPLQLSHANTVTPERAVVSAASGTFTTGASPATAHRQTRRGSTSALSDTSTPPPSHPHPAERTRTPIPFSRRRLAKHSERDSPSLLLELSEDAMEPAVARASNLSNSSQLFAAGVARRSSSRRGGGNGSHTGGEASAPLTPDRAGHTPMAPFPRRPSLLSRERASASKGKAGLLTPDQSRCALIPQRSLASELKETPSKTLSPVDGKRSLGDV